MIVRRVLTAALALVTLLVPVAGFGTAARADDAYPLPKHACPVYLVQLRVQFYVNCEHPKAGAGPVAVFGGTVDPGNNVSPWGDADQPGQTRAGNFIDLTGLVVRNVPPVPGVCWGHCYEPFAAGGSVTATVLAAPPRSLGSAPVESDGSFKIKHVFIPVTGSVILHYSGNGDAPAADNGLLLSDEYLNVFATAAWSARVRPVTVKRGSRVVITATFRDPASHAPIRHSSCRVEQRQTHGPLVPLFGKGEQSYTDSQGVCTVTWVPTQQGAYEAAVYLDGWSTLAGWWPVSVR
ncbi:hypothetical protein EV189_2301 [Motilibacter rhizosphaerae]|uniref:Ig-like domain-containing protein n=1 Tax=Motilibacter rhizosphaerae TaxID=598652 RepID=A0A4Q7NNS3_9ACTN|nr:hypothetical protein [Motilibacter rhizosphaerae]RZS86885.1 hypothetical protein EV189_2301 [Motilibacter rhizosphaerae]